MVDLHKKIHIEANDGSVEMSLFYQYGGEGIDKALSNLNPLNIAKGAVNLLFFCDGEKIADGIENEVDRGINVVLNGDAKEKLNYATEKGTEAVIASMMAKTFKSPKSSNVLDDLDELDDFADAGRIADEVVVDEFTGTGGKRGCFIAGTKIISENGQKNIENIKVGELVLAKNLKTGEQNYREVISTFVVDTYQLIVIKINGKTIETTSEHPFWTQNRGWIKAGELLEEDILEDSEGNELEIEEISIVQLDNPIKVYNFEVADYHTYYVSDNGVLVHNKPMKNPNISNGNVDFIVGENGVVESVSNGQRVLQRHVGKNDVELLQRLKANPKLTGVSTFTNDIISNQVIKATLNKQVNINKINSWLSNGAKGNLPLYYKGNTVIGRGVKQGSNLVKNMTNAKVILKSNGKGGYDILTAYPN